MTPLATATLAMGLPLRFLRRQHPHLENALQLNLGPGELESVLAACARCHVRLGSYYEWYFQKLVIARQLRSLSAPKIMQKLSSRDMSRYDVLERAHSATGGRGLIIAIPHHAHYILSIIGVAEHLRGHRSVLIFYGSPSTHKGNDLFDHMYRALFRDETSNVRVIHDTRAGLASAIRGLNDGAAVVIMPDVHKHERDTYLVPFCGRPLNVMLGTAALARRTGATILPAVSRTCGRGLRFATEFAEPIETGEARDSYPDEGPVAILHQDYNTTANLFRIYESKMSPSIIHWQYVRTHFSRKAEFPVMSPDQIQVAADLLFDDIRIRSLKQPAIPLTDAGSL